MVLDAQALKGLCECLRLVHLLAVLAPSLRRPQLKPIAGPDHHDLRLQPRGIAKRLRKDEATLAIERNLERGAVQVPSKRPRTGVGEGQGVDLLGELHPLSVGMKYDASVDPLAYLAALGELCTETRRDRETSLVVDRVSILACKHRAGLAPTVTSLVSAAGHLPTPALTAKRLRLSLIDHHGGRPTGPVHLFSPLRTTSCHLDWHHTQFVESVKGRSASSPHIRGRDAPGRWGRGTDWP